MKPQSAFVAMLLKISMLRSHPPPANMALGSIGMHRPVKRTPCPGCSSPAVHASVGKCADTEFLRGQLNLKRNAILASMSNFPDENPETCKVSRVNESSDWDGSVAASAVQGLEGDFRHPPSDADPRGPVSSSGLVPPAPPPESLLDLHSAKVFPAKDSHAQAESLAQELLVSQAYDASSCLRLFDLMPKDANLRRSQESTPSAVRVSFGFYVKGRTGAHVQQLSRHASCLQVLRGSRSVC